MKKALPLYALVLVIVMMLVVITLMLSKKAIAPSESLDMADSTSSANQSSTTAEISDCYLSDNEVVTKQTKCVFSIQENTKDGELEVTPQGIILTRKDKEVLSLGCDSESGFEDMSEQRDCSLIEGQLTFEDVTKDGYTDVKLKTSCGAYQCAYAYYLYDKQSDSYKKSEILTDVMEPTFQSETATIETYSKGRGIGDIFITETFSLQSDGAFLLTESCLQDMVSFGDPETDYVYVCKKWNGVIMATTSQEILTNKEVW